MPNGLASGVADGGAVASVDDPGELERGDATASADTTERADAMGGDADTAAGDSAPPPASPGASGCDAGGGELPWALVAFTLAWGLARRRRAALLALLVVALSGLGGLAADARAADADADGDGVRDQDDRCPGPDGTDGDGDGWPSGCDCDDSDPDIHPGAADVCNGVDDDCDGRLDVNTAFSAAGGQLVSEGGSGGADITRAVSVTDGGATMHVPASSKLLDPFYTRPLDLVLKSTVNTVHISFSRKIKAGDSDFAIGLTDGVRFLLAKVIDTSTPGSMRPQVIAGIRNPSIAGIGVAAGANMATFQDAADFWATFEMGADATVTIRAGGEVRTGHVARSNNLDPSRAWSLVIVADTGESYDIGGVAVWQDLPAGGGAEDADGDGYTAGCDCDDTDAAVHPGALDLCDGVDQDCGGDGDGITYSSLPGVGLLSDVLIGKATNPSGRPLTPARSEVLVGPGGGAAAELFYRRPIRLVGGGGGAAVIDLTLDREAPPGASDLQLGLSDGVRILAVGLSDAGAADGTQVAFGPRWGGDGGAVVTSPAVGASDVLAESGPYRFRFRLGATSRVSVTTASGVTLARDYPSAAGALDLAGPLDVVLYAGGAEESYRIRHLTVSQGPLDADGDGICDGFDRCIGDDNGPDRDGDGWVVACDCDDRPASIAPGRPEVCDGVDQDCDGHGDLARLAGARGSELLGRVAAGLAQNPAGAGAYAQAGGHELVLVPRADEGAVVYRERLSGLRASDDPTRLALSLSFRAGTTLSPALTIALSDGANAAGLAISLTPGPNAPARRAVAFAYYASDEGPTLAFVEGATSAGVSVGDVVGLRVTLTVPRDGPATMGYTLEDAAGGGASGSYEIPAERLPDLLGDVDLVLGAGDPETTYGVEDVRVSQVLLDDDQDGVCDALDRCPGADDTRDADGDTIPDACDLCLGPDGTADLDHDGFPSGCDCDDAAAGVNPDAADSCNAVDDDCDGVTDVHTALRVRGGELLSRLASGRAAGGARPSSGFQFGAIAEFGPTTGPAFDVYYREPMALLPATGASQRLRVVFDRDAVSGDNDFIIAVSDGSRVFGVGLYDVGGSGTRFRALPVSGEDGGAVVTAALGTGVELDEASPYTLDLVLGAGAGIDLTAADGVTVTSLVPASGDAGRLSSGTLSLLLIGAQPGMSYRVRSVVVSQALPDADGDLVCDAVDYCDGADDRGVDSDGDGIVDPCDVCPLADDRADADGDGVPDACDLCDGSPDAEDADHDGLPDGCDPCPDDPANDFDGDGVCDHSDTCLAGDDALDADGDGVPDACDPCPADAADDSDEDGTCDSADVCLGDDRTGDKDGDGFCGDRDCDDTRASVHPGAAEVCDGFDSDCDGALGPGELDTDGDYVIQCQQAHGPGAEGPAASEGPEATSGSAGCGAGGGAGAGGAWLVALLALGLLRRRRPPREDQA